MKALIQRVKHASVEVDGELVGKIDQGVLLFLGVEKHDDQVLVERMCNKVLTYRIFDNDQGRMDRSLIDVNGGLLVVSQFTLAADTKKGKKPSFSSAAPPVLGEDVYEAFVARARDSLGTVETGRFGADMKVGLLNDGPVTFMLEM